MTTKLSSRTAPLVAVCAGAFLIVAGANAAATNPSHAVPTPPSVQGKGGIHDQYPRMRAYEAKRFSLRFLHAKFDPMWENGYLRTNDCERATWISFRCKVRWVLGDTYYHGHTRPFWSDIDADFVYWNVGYKIERVNEYCLGTGGDHCRKTFRGVW